MNTLLLISIAVCFIWLGMVTAISFLEAPLKFRAPGITIPLGLGIGRLVFRALNTCEALLGVTLVALLVFASEAVSNRAVTLIVTAVPVLMLLTQLIGVRPALTRRSDRVLAGHVGERSRAHFWYVGLEIVKVAGLVALGASLILELS